MKKIIHQRGGGKTTELIRYAAETGGTIVCEASSVHRITAMAYEMGLDIPKPVSYYEAKFFLERGSYNRNNLLIDNVELFVQYLFNDKVGAITMSLPEDVELLLSVKAGTFQSPEHKKNFVDWVTKASKENWLWPMSIGMDTAKGGDHSASIVGHVCQHCSHLIVNNSGHREDCHLKQPRPGETAWQVMQGTIVAQPNPSNRVYGTDEMEKECHRCHQWTGPAHNEGCQDSDHPECAWFTGHHAVISVQDMPPQNHDYTCELCNTLIRALNPYDHALGCSHRPPEFPKDIRDKGWA